MLPNSLILLELSDQYTQVIKKGILPSSLICLTYGSCWIEKIKKDELPKSLIYLIFGYSYDQQIDKNILPKSLTHLTFGYYYSQILEKDVLPDSLIELTIFGSIYNKSIIDNVPNGIKIIVFQDLQISVNNLPMTVEKIKLINHDDKILKLLTKIPYGCVVVDGDDIIIKQ